VTQKTRQKTQRRQGVRGMSARCRRIRRSVRRRPDRWADALRGLLGVVGVLLYLGSSVALSVHGHSEAAGAAAPHALALHPAEAHASAAPDSNSSTDSNVSPNTEAVQGDGAAPDASVVDVSPAFDARDPGEDRSRRSALHDCQLCELAQRASRVGLALPTAAAPFHVLAKGRPRLVYTEPAPAEDPALRRQAPRAPPHRLRT